ncbi:hypothetical protein M5K25_006067 [Dendrobium thyrsiflorum]|uniref:Uncharacterized protein n=1 Tax=Dendrobium thyrsiflorum TaxID=117978 RepID=A0ABD0VAX4_DENTH
MADPEIDQGFVEDAQGQTDILRSPFFDIRWGYDQSVEDYIDRILYQLTLSIKEHIRPDRWQIVGRPPTLQHQLPLRRTRSYASLVLWWHLSDCF